MLNVIYVTAATIYVFSPYCVPCSLPVDSPVLSLFWKKIIYSFTFAVLGLRCCVRTFSRYSEWVLLSMGTLYSPWVCRLLIVVASLIAKRGL